MVVVECLTCKPLLMDGKKRKDCLNVIIINQTCNDQGASFEASNIWENKNNNGFHFRSQLNPVNEDPKAIFFSWYQQGPMCLMDYLLSTTFVLSFLMYIILQLAGGINCEPLNCQLTLSHVVSMVLPLILSHLILAWPWCTYRILYLTESLEYRTTQALSHLFQTNLWFGM